MGAELKPIFTWRSAIVESGLPPTVRHVALTLSLHMNERGGSCFPSRAQLSAETGLSVRTVERAIRELEEAGYLRVERPAKRKGRGHANTYEACLPTRGQERTSVALLSEPAGQEGRTCDAHPAGKGEPVTRKGEPVTPQDVIEDVIATPLERSETSSPRAPSPRGGRRAATERPPDEIFEALFVLEAGEPYSPEARRRLTRKAAAALNAAAAEVREAGVGAEELRAAIRAWPRVMGSATCTAHAVAKHLPRLLAAARGFVARRSELDEVAEEAERRLAARNAGVGP